METAQNFGDACQSACVARRSQAPGPTLSDVFARLAAALDAGAPPVKWHVRSYQRPGGRVSRVTAQ